jgi:hypothetical protein
MIRVLSLLLLSNVPASASQRHDKHKLQHSSVTAQQPTVSCTMLTMLPLLLLHCCCHTAAAAALLLLHCCCCTAAL